MKIIDGTLVGHVSGQVDDWQEDVDEESEELVMGKFDAEGDELGLAELLIRILEELLNRELVPEGRELEMVELLINILEELLARVLDAKGSELVAEARLNEDEVAAADEKFELDTNGSDNEEEDTAAADELEPGAEIRDEDAAALSEEVERLDNDDDVINALV